MVQLLLYGSRNFLLYSINFNNNYKEITKITVAHFLICIGLENVCHLIPLYSIEKNVSAQEYGEYSWVLGLQNFSK